MKSAKEYWKKRFGEYPKNDKERLAVAMMSEFAESELQPKPTTSAEAKQNLFNYFAQEHGIQLMDSDFVEIEEYMRPESDRKAMEFSKFVSSINATVWVWDEEDNVWRSVKDGKMYKISTSQLFAKFEEERSKQ